MIAACPRCSARYRVDPERIGAGGARLKCAKCAAVFRVRAPAAGAERSEPPGEPAAEAPVERAPRTPEREATAAGDQQATRVDRDRLVVIADPEVDSGKRCAAAIASWGLHPILVHDGVEAMLSIQRMLPRTVILDAALPKMYGFQVCEVVKRNESLRDTTVALIGAIHHKDRYRRPPSELYGADVYLERPDLPDALLPVLRQAGMPVRSDMELEEQREESQAPAPEGGAEESLELATPQPTRAPAPVPEATAPPAAAPVPEATAPPAAAPAPEATAASVAATDEGGFADERAKAERLARIIISDIVLYNAEKFEAAIAGGNACQALDAELQEGRTLFMQRIDARVRDERDYLGDELERVARERSG